jgi:hypothetical protein
MTTETNQDYRAFMELMNNLPDGWMRNPNYDVASGNSKEPPFLHSSGKVSWKNPNQKKVLQMIETENAKKVTEETVSYKVGKTVLPAGNKTLIKKLRLMLQAGAPLEAVERRAQVEGIDMEAVLQQEYAANNKVENKENSVVTISPVLLKKYSECIVLGTNLIASLWKAHSYFLFLPSPLLVRMRKMGVGLAQVQQLAFVEAKVRPEQLEELFRANQDEKRETLQVGVASPNHGKMQKYLKMQQAGLPLPAIQQAAELDGNVALDELMVGLGLVEKVDVDASMEKEESPETKQYFEVIGLNKIVLDANSDLATLVRKMAHSVDKTSRGSGTVGENNTVTVDVMTLYHALGSFQGVQVARDDYNDTCDSDTWSKPNALQWFKAKRQSFCEMARGVGMKLPKDLSTTVDVAGLDELVGFLEERFRSELANTRRLLDQGFYDFDCLGVMYAPGSRVVAKNAGGGGVDMVCKVAWNRYQQGKTIMGTPTKYFQVCLEYVVAVGAKAATIAEVVEGMESFEGRRSLLGGLLQFVPLGAYSVADQDALLQRYRRRGQIYNEVALNATNDGDVSQAAKSYSYKAYQKGSFFLKHGGGAGTLVGGGGNPSAALASGGRIIIDNQGAYEYGHSLNIGHEAMITGIKYKLKEYKLLLRDKAKNNDSRASGNGDHRHDDNTMVLFDRIPDDFLEFVWPSVIGFSLSTKAWGDCLVDGLEDIAFAEDVFERLVLPESRKRLVKALVKHSSGSVGGTHGFHDLIAGKGEGIVFLLYGPPGVGKTLTAEAVSEVLKRPLFSVSMGTLGTTADELEKRLGEILKLSAKWDAIILLDEADSFLETRSSTSSLERNAMVSVMLKLVEYFSGILFLTSNRFDSLDPAFQTRITLSLEYENLDEASREKVWDNLLSKSGISTCGDIHGVIDIQELAQFPLNGREIKNALRLALALSMEENRPLSHTVLMETAAMITPVGKGGVAKKSGCISLTSWWN